MKPVPEVPRTTTVMNEPVAVFSNPFDPNFLADPYPAYLQLMEGPPRALAGFPIGLVARYEHVIAVLRDPKQFTNRRLKIFEADEDPRADPFGGSLTMLTADPPDHTRLRRLVMRAFTPRRIRELEPRVRQITDHLLDEAAAKGSFDAIADLANPLPVAVIAELLGVPVEMHRTFKEWSDLIVAADFSARGPGVPVSAESLRAIVELRDFFTREIEKRRQSGSDDLIGALLAQHESEALDAGELLAFLNLILLAGNETTTNLIANGLLQLCRHPEQLQALRRDPNLMPSAIEEILRYDPPVQMTLRFPTGETRVAGVTFAPRTLIAVMLAAANRDPEKFPRPTQFDITRTPNEHVSFGEGIHYCIGAALAKLEGSIAIGTTLERFPKLQIGDPSQKLSYKGSILLRGLVSLPLQI